MHIRSAILALVAVGRIAGAQVVPPDVLNRNLRNIFAHQLESTFITWNQASIGNLDSLHFEGLIAPHFIFGQTQRWAVVITPKIVLRMRTDDSAPVVAPSYMPRGTVYLRTNDPKALDDSVYYAFATLSHHSNGQDGPFHNPDGSVNTRTGSFSTNFVRFGFVYGASERYCRARDTIPETGLARFIITSREADCRRLTAAQFDSVRTFSTFGLSAEIHPQAWIADSLRPFYAPTRFHLSANVPVGRGVNALEVSYLVGKHLGVDGPRHRYTISYSQGHPIGPLRSGNFGLLLQLYYGLDYYNMRFNSRVSTLRVGVISIPGRGEGPVKGWGF